MSENTTRAVVWSFGERIRKAREDKGWKQADLAERMHIGRATIANWENNVNRPNFATLRWVAELTGYPLEFFTDEADTEALTQQYAPDSQLALFAAA